jgi:glutathione S-transferase
MIQVHKFGPTFGLPDASPFVLKVETYLRMTDQKYEAVASDVRKAPRAQLPYVTIDGKVVPDSTEIIDHLEAARSQKLDAHLDDKERAVALAFKSMLEEHLYFGLLFMRWTTDDGWTVFDPAMREMLATMGVPSLMRGMVARSARKHVTTRTRTQGVGRMPRAQVVATCNKLVDALAVQMGDKAYVCGDKLTTYDATAYAFIAQVLCPAFANELQKHVAAKKNLVAYAQRMKDAYWKD